MAAEVLRQPNMVSAVQSIPIQAYHMYSHFPPRSRENVKKVYYCQRCLNHDTPRPRKNHKCECPYADCNCEKCGLVEKRRILNWQLSIYNSEGDMEKKSDDDDDRKLKGGQSLSDRS
ncbi:unnamed protein product [Caenorhabditis sp. 36 PRJEB53466]|nr:unnamed protein product [Caenorhabditis sp. 36 PRJEB53466]